MVVKLFENVNASGLKNIAIRNFKKYSCWD